MGDQDPCRTFYDASPTLKSVRRLQDFLGDYDKLLMSKNLPADPNAKGAWTQMLGPLAPFFDDPHVTEIMINGPYKVFVEQNGIIKRTGVKFPDSESLLKLMQSLCKNVGRDLGSLAMCVDGRLPDGSRFNCVIPPVSVDGPTLTIRKFSPGVLTHEKLIESGMMDERIAYFLSCCVAAKLNLIVVGGTGSGKTTLLNVLSSFIPSHERIVTIEDSAELKIKNENLVRLEAKPAFGSEPAVTIRHLVTNALRMRPDRILVGECRGAEALDMLFAMNTGHEGSMTTLHANSAREGLRRLESMVLMAGAEMPLKVVRQNISSALNVIVHVQRWPDGKRRITEILEVGGMESDVILTQDIFKFVAPHQFKCSGFVPQFVKLFKERGIDFPADFFTDSYMVRAKKT